MGTVPEEKNWLIGFRPVIGNLPDTKPQPVPPPPLNRKNVVQTIPPDIGEGPDPAKPYFDGPRKYVNIPEGSDGPIFSEHNHVPNIAQCPNGDLLAIWYTTVSEKGRELAIVASRLRYGTVHWEPASVFWDQPDRNDHTPALWCDGKNTLYHFNGFSAASTWGPLAVILRTSKDNGQTWSRAKIILPEHNRRQMPIESIFRTGDNCIVLPCDAVTGGSGGSAIYLSSDDGRTWSDAGGTIAGIHACVAQLDDGRLLAFGRGDNIDDRMPMSISDNMGKSWSYKASCFPPIGGGQRPVILKLKEDPLVLVSFSGSRKRKENIAVTDRKGVKKQMTGMFAALSLDGGRSWPNIRPVSHDGELEKVETMDGRLFDLDYLNAEPVGYLSICQTADGLIHLITSRQEYIFNLAWLKEAMPAKTDD
jgi:hypothetical protein